MAHPLDGPEFRGGRARRKWLRSVPPQHGQPVQDTSPACACGHGKTAHEHYRRGSDCALCDCRRYHRSLLVRLGIRKP